MLAIGGIAQAQGVAGLLPIDQAYQLTAKVSTPGVITLHWTIAPHYYLYRGQMKFTGGDGVTLGTAQLPNGKKYHDEYLGDVETYHDSIAASIPYTLAPGTQRIKFSVRYQGCHEVDPKICYPPHTETFDLPLPGSGAAAGVGAVNSPGSGPPSRDSLATLDPAPEAQAGVTSSAPAVTTGRVTGSVSADSSLNVSLPWALLLAFVGGLILNLMPCVLPVLAIKAVGVLESGESRQRARTHAFAYGAGVVVSFLSIGIVILALRGAGDAVGWGTQMQQPIVVAVLACVLFAVGLSMSGVVQFGAQLGNVGQNLTRRGGAAGHFFTGVLAVVVASPCTAPFMGAALAYAFTAPASHEILVMLVLGIGLALPLTLIGLVPALARLLPKPGRWMETLKQLLAFPMYLSAVWLMWVLAHQRGADAMALALVAMVLIAAAAWWHAHGRPERTLGHVFTVVLVLAAVASLYGIARVVSTARAAVASSESHVAFSPAKLKALRDAGTPVFVDMTADWCITCKANEHTVLDTAAFRELLKRTGTVYMVGDWTDVDPVIGAFLKKYHSPGVPLYVVFPKNGGAGKVLPTVLTASMVRNALETASNPLVVSSLPEAWTDLSRAEALVRAQKPMEALRVFIAAIDADPDSYQAHQALLKFEEAEDISGGASAHDSKSKEISKISSILDKQYAEWARRYPQSPVMELSIGLRLGMTEDPRAAQHLQRYLALDSVNANIHAQAHAKAYAMLANLALFRGNAKANEAYLQKAMMLEPNNANYAINYAYAVKSDASALEVMRRFPGTEVAAAAFSIMADNATENTKRIEVLQRMLTQFPPAKFDASNEAASELYGIYLQMGDSARALKLAQQMQKVRTSSPNASDGNWAKQEKLARACLEAQRLVGAGIAGNTGKINGLVEALSAEQYQPYAAMLVRLKAQVLVAAGRADEAYKDLLQQQVVAPDAETRTSLQHVGGLLHKPPKQVEDDLKAALYAHAKMAPSFDLKEYGTDQSVSLAKLRGKVVFLTFWFPGCGPCRAELPRLETVVKQFPRADVAFLGINVDGKQDSDVLPFVTNGKHIFTPLKGTEAVEGHQGYNVRGTPMNFLIDRGGRIVYSGFEIDDVHGEQVLSNMINSLM